MIWMDRTAIVVQNKYRCCRIAGTVYRRQGRFEDLSAKQTVRAWTYYFYYWAIHPAATGDTYTHLLEDKYEEAIIAGIAYKCCERLKDWDAAAKWKGDYESILLKKAARTKRLKVSVHSNFWGQMG